MIVRRQSFGTHVLASDVYGRSSLRSTDTVPSTSAAVKPILGPPPSPVFSVPFGTLAGKDIAPHIALVSPKYLPVRREDLLGSLSDVWEWAVRFGAAGG